MVKTLAVSLLLSSLSLCAESGSMVGTLEGKVMEISFAGAMKCVSTQPVPTNVWKYADYTPMLVQFPADFEKNFRTVSPAAEVAGYSFSAGGKQYGTVTLRLPDAELQLNFSFTGAQEGVAALTWSGKGETLHLRDMRFRLQPAPTPEGRVVLPQPLPDTLPGLLAELEARRYATAVERLYQRRLLTALQNIWEGSFYVDTVLENANGTTALHNACGLSHTEIVRWLVEHGADTEARTAKGASVDDCVGGPNAAAIRDILHKVRHK
ncbi:MAG: ankyrin repeat domain-containing protein [Akkermansia sp.]|nr:ankyrin repeat domain-containing protein [Akkermansia sp.]